MGFRIRTFFLFLLAAALLAAGCGGSSKSQESGGDTRPKLAKLKADGSRPLSETVYSFLSGQKLASRHLIAALDKGVLLDIADAHDGRRAIASLYFGIELICGKSPRDPSQDESLLWMLYFADSNALDPLISTRIFTSPDELLGEIRSIMAAYPNLGIEAESQLAREYKQGYSLILSPQIVSDGQKIAANFGCDSKELHNLLRKILDYSRSRLPAEAFDQMPGGPCVQFVAVMELGDCADRDPYSIRKKVFAVQVADLADDFDFSSARPEVARIAKALVASPDDNSFRVLKSMEGRAAFENALSGDLDDICLFVYGLKGTDYHYYLDEIEPAVSRQFWIDNGPWLSNGKIEQYLISNIKTDIMGYFPRANRFQNAIEIGIEQESFDLCFDTLTKSQPSQIEVKKMLSMFARTSWGRDMQFQFVHQPL